MLHTQISDQANFMKLGGQSTNRPDWPQAARYVDHLAEETLETLDSIDEKDVIKLVDGLVDAMVTAAGALISLLGAEGAERAWDAVSDANLAKVDGRYGPLRWRDDGQVGKPEGWTGPETELRAIIEDVGLALPEV